MIINPPCFLTQNTLFRPYRKFFGWCVFNRGSDNAPAWVTSLFTMPYYSEEYGLVENGIGDGDVENPRWKVTEEQQMKINQEDKAFWQRKWKDLQGDNHT